MPDQKTDHKQRDWELAWRVSVLGLLLVLAVDGADAIEQMSAGILFGIGFAGAFVSLRPKLSGRGEVAQ